MAPNYLSNSSQAFPPPVFDCTAVMQTWKGKAWEIWSRAVMSGRQRVDTLVLSV